MTTNYATHYAQALANTYPYTLMFGRLWGASKPEYKPINANTVKIPKLTVKGRRNGDRDTIGSFGKNWDNSWETKVLTRHRTWNTLVHPNDINQTNQVASIANITKTMNETQKFPEMDAELLNDVYAAKTAVTGAKVYELLLTVDNVLFVFNDIMDQMDEAGVPVNGRLLYVDTYTKTLIDTAKMPTRANGDESYKMALNRLEEVEIISVPTKAMKSKYTFYDGVTEGQTDGGFVAADDAKDIKMFLVHPSAVLPIVNYEFSELGAPSSLSQGKYTYFEESFEDVFILEALHEGIQFVVGLSDTAFDVTSAAGTANVGDTVLTASGVNVGHKAYYKLATGSPKAVDKNSMLPSEYTEISSTAVAAGSNTKAIVCEANALGMVVESKVITLTKKTA